MKQLPIGRRIRWNSRKVIFLMELEGLKGRERLKDMTWNLLSNIRENRNQVNEDMEKKSYIIASGRRNC